MQSECQLISVKEAAAILNRTPSAVYRAIADGRLLYDDVLHRKLDRRNLEERFARSTRPRADKPMASPAPARATKPTFEESWQAIADSANQILDPEAWGPPPWTAHQWGVLAGALDIAIADDGEKRCIQN